METSNRKRKIAVKVKKYFSTVTAIISCVSMILSVAIVSNELHRLYQIRKLYLTALENTLEEQKVLTDQVETITQIIEKLGCQ